MTEKSGPGSSTGRRRSLLRGSSVHGRVLHKARERGDRERDDDPGRDDTEARRAATPSPDPAVEQPTLAEVIVDRPPPVRSQGPAGQAPPTWDDLPPDRVAAPPAAEPPEATSADPEATSLEAGVDEAWFDAADGTLEPAEEREHEQDHRLPPAGAWLALGGVAAAVLLLIFAIAQGTTVSTADQGSSEAAPVAADQPAGWEQAQPDLVGMADEQPLDEPAADEPAADDPSADDPSADEPAAAGAHQQTAAAAQPGRADEPSAARPAAPAAGAPGGESVLDRYRSAVAGNPLMQGADEADEPAGAGPAELPEGSADLWADLDRDAQGDDLWGHLAAAQE